MKLVIDVPENNYRALQKMSECGLGRYQQIILDGVPVSDYMAEELENCKQLDYELYIRTQGYSHLDEEQWDWLIKNFKVPPKSEKENSNDRRRN